MNDNIPGVMKYRKKPVVIEAIQYTEDNYKDVIRFVGVENCDVTVNHLSMDKILNPEMKEAIITFFIKTLEGKMLVSYGDFVIKGVKGEFYPCKPDIFWQTYEEELF